MHRTSAWPRFFVQRLFYAVALLNVISAVAGVDQDDGCEIVCYQSYSQCSRACPGDSPDSSLQHASSYAELREHILNDQVGVVIIEKDLKVEGDHFHFESDAGSKDLFINCSCDDFEKPVTWKQFYKNPVCKNRCVKEVEGSDYYEYKRLPLVPIIEGRHVMIKGKCEGGSRCVLNGKIDYTNEYYYHWVSFCDNVGSEINETLTPLAQNFCDTYGFYCSIRNDGSLTLERIRITGAARTRHFIDPRYVNTLNRILPPDLIQGIYLDFDKGGGGVRGDRTSFIGLQFVTLDDCHAIVGGAVAATYGTNILGQNNHFYANTATPVFSTDGKKLDYLKEFAGDPQDSNYTIPECKEIDWSTAGDSICSLNQMWKGGEGGAVYFGSGQYVDHQADCDEFDRCYDGASSAIFYNSEFVDNVAAISGGGFAQNYQEGTSIFANTVFSGNVMGGIFKLLSFCKLSNMSDAEFEIAIQPLFKNGDFVELTNEKIIDSTVEICKPGVISGSGYYGDTVGPMFIPTKASVGYLNRAILWKIPQAGDMLTTETGTTVFSSPTPTNSTLKSLARNDDYDKFKQGSFGHACENEKSFNTSKYPYNSQMVVVAQLTENGDYHNFENLCSEDGLNEVGKFFKPFMQVKNIPDYPLVSRCKGSKELANVVLNEPLDLEIFFADPSKYYLTINASESCYFEEEKRPELCTPLKDFGLPNMTLVDWIMINSTDGGPLRIDHFRERIGEFQKTFNSSQYSYTYLGSDDQWDQFKEDLDQTFYVSAYTWHDLEDQDSSVTVTAICSDVVDLKDKNESMRETFAKLIFSSSYEIPILDSSSAEYATWSEEIWYGPDPQRGSRNSNTSPRHPLGESSLYPVILALCSVLLIAVILLIVRVKKRRESSRHESLKYERIKNAGGKIAGDHGHMAVQMSNSLSSDGSGESSLSNYSSDVINTPLLGMNCNKAPLSCPLRASNSTPSGIGSTSEWTQSISDHSVESIPEEAGDGFTNLLATGLGCSEHTKGMRGNAPRDARARESASDIRRCISTDDYSRRNVEAPSQFKPSRLDRSIEETQTGADMLLEDFFRKGPFEQCTEGQKHLKRSVSERPTSRADARPRRGNRSDTQFPSGDGARTILTTFEKSRVSESSQNGSPPSDSSSSVNTSVSGVSSQIGFSQVIEWFKGQKIGQGSCGKGVFKGVRSNGEIMAVKQVELRNLRSPQIIEDCKALESEIEVLRKLRHPNIVRYIGGQREKEGSPPVDVLNVFLEYVPGGSIHGLIQEIGCFEESLIRVYTKQILVGLEYLHGKNVVHRDIKGMNILVHEDGIVKLADFGASRTLENLHLMSNPESAEQNIQQSIRGTPQFMAPEVIRQQPCRKASDIWSVGATVVEMATGRPPFADMNFSQPFSLFMHVGRDNAMPKIPDCLSEEGQDFLKQCFAPNPDDRPTAVQLLEHPFIADAEKYNMGQGVAPYPGSLRHEESIEAIALYEKNARAQSEQSDPSF